MKTLRLLTLAALAIGISSALSAEVTINVTNDSGKTISVNLFKPLNTEFEESKPVWEKGIKDLANGKTGFLRKNIGAGTYKLNICNSSKDFSTCLREATVVVPVMGHKANATFNFKVTADAIEEID